MYAGLTGAGTDEAAVFATLRGRSPEHLGEIKRLYQEHYGVSLDSDLKRELGGAEFSRATALLAGDPTQATVEELRTALSANGPRALLGALEAVPSSELASVGSRFAASAGQPLEAAIQQRLFGPDRDVALALLRGQRPQADAVRLDKALHLTGNSSHALEVLERSPDKTALAQAYQQRTSRPLEGDLKKSLRGTQQDLAVAVLSGDAGGATVARLRNAVEGKVMGLGKDATAALAIIESTPIDQRAALAQRYQQKHQVSLSADVKQRFGGRDEERLTKALTGKLDDVERIQMRSRATARTRAPSRPSSRAAPPTRPSA